MDITSRTLMMGAAGAGAAADKLYIEDVFSTFLYTGNGSTQTITNDIDLSGKNGLTWIKGRSGATGHRFTDTVRGATKSLESNSTAAEIIESTGVTSFNSTSFALGADADYNTNGAAYVSWTFRKAAKFFDVVTYTGNGANRTISHNLGSVPGTIFIKRTDSAADWQVYHRSLANTEYLVLNSTAAKATGATRWNSTTPTSTEFSLGTDTTVNANGGTYVAYLFAHDAGGFGDSGNDNVISCGSYTASPTGSPVPIDLGWEPQWLLIKRIDSAGNWNLHDSVRGFSDDNNTTDAPLLANNTNSEGGSDSSVAPLSTGFLGLYEFSATYIYIAIRRGPMKTPTDATKVFQAKLYTGTNVDNRLVITDILTDMVWVRRRNDIALNGMVVGDRLRGQGYLLTGSTAISFPDPDSFDQQSVSATEYGTAFSSMTGFWVGNDVTSRLNTDTTSNSNVVHAFRRAPGFFDAVAYTGSGQIRTVNHNLSAIPELIIIKNRFSVADWVVYSAVLGNTKYLTLNLNFAAGTGFWNNTNPTSSVFTVDTNSVVNANLGSYIAYLFASCPGVSKVGGYTGTGTTLGIDCGFTAGARFVLIKRTDTTGDWYVWDTARGIISANDPYLLLNSTAAEVTNTDYIDPLSSGFEISSTAPAAINANGGSFIYLAIA